MASKSKNKGTTPELNSVKFVEGSLWTASVLNAVKDTPNVIRKIKEFQEVKSKNPMAPYGTNDRPFASTGLYKQYLPKAMKAHLTPDISVVYELSGRNPTIIRLYGVFTHADMGTGQPPNKNVQKSMAARLSNSFNENLEVFFNKLLKE